MGLGINNTKSAARASHEALEETNEAGSSVTSSTVDHLAMEGAKRAQNRIHGDETEIPGNTLFTK